MNLALLAFIPAAAAQTLIFPGVSPFRLGDGNITAKATRDGWDTAFATINATGSATIPGKNIRAPFPGNSSSDWKYTISVRDDVPHANGSGFFTATWLQLEAPQELLTETTVNETRKVQTIARDDSWDVCTYVFFGEEYSISDKTVGPGCEGFWEDPGACAKGLEEALVNGFGEEETEIMGKKTRCALPWPSLVPMTCRSGGVGSMLALEHSLDFMSADSSWLGNGNFGFHKFAEARDVHDRGNTTAYDRARKRVFIVGHVWGHKTDAASQGAKVEASVRCLQANGGPKEQNIRPVDGEGGSAESASENGAVSSTFASVLLLGFLTSAVFFSL